MMIEVDDLSRKTADKIIADGKESREMFLRTVPPSSWVWQNPDRQVRGLTMGDQRIYVDPNSDWVAVECIQGNENLMGLWQVADIVKLTRNEINGISNLVSRG